VEDEHVWSYELYRICDIEPGSKTTRQTFVDLVHPDDVDRIQAVIEDAIRGVDREIVYRIVTAKGVTKHLRTAGTVVDRIEGRYIITGAIQDITESKLVEEELKANQSNLARALDHLVEAQRLSSTGSFTIDVERDKHDWSDELYRIFELEIGSVVTIEVVAAAIVPEDRHVYESAIRLGREGHNPDFEFRIALSDGRIKHLRAVAHRNMRVPDRFVFVGAIIDLTASKLAEEALNNARAELAQMSRTLSLGALTASIAHEVNQPLSGIITNASASLRMLGASPPNVAGAMVTAERTIRDANRAAAVITRLRSLFKRKHQTPESVDLSEEAREALMLTAGELQRHRITVRTVFGENIPSVQGDRLQLLQVVLNLVRNAADAMGETEQGPREIQITTAHDGNSATLSVRDSGVGIDPENVEKLFDAFYTTKADGMGIGLSISRSIIESHRGRLWARANDGPGATFSFSLPAKLER
jgi:signal transduction histidine kinase